jgi:aspartyl-tRNA(Asn)/glutamyl-tRNA(Gln) amidotransferase subunit A
LSVIGRPCLARCFGEIDVLLLPTATTVVPRLTEAKDPQTLSPENTVFANYYGLLALSVPCGLDSNGLPIGLQIVAGPSGDLDILTLGQQYERAAEWVNGRPVS